MDEDWPPVPQREIDKVKRYVGKLMKLMNIKWDITVMSYYRPGCQAAVDCYTNIHTAQLWIGQSWPDLDRDERRNALVHEMIHVMYAETDQHVTNVITKSLPKTAREVARAGYTNVMEQATDRIASTIDGFYPEYPA